MDGVLRDAAGLRDSRYQRHLRYRTRPTATLSVQPTKTSFLLIHVYDTETSRPVATILRSGKTPLGVEVRAHLRQLVRRIRARWPTTRILFRADITTWCELDPRFRTIG